MKPELLNDFLPISANDICIITPTFNRIKQLNNFLKTLADQTTKVGNIFIADGKGNAQTLVDSYKNKLPLIWLNCPVQGQLPQRNYALEQLPDDCKLVIYFDDDVQLENNAIEEMIIFWNQQKKVPGGVCFNTTNSIKQSKNFLRHIFFLGLTPPGRVWKSGYNAPLSYSDEESLQCDWLPGGSTAWRKDILLNNPMPNVSSSWSICEDLIFSYPVGKLNPLLVSRYAKVKFVDEISNFGFYKCVARGRNAVFWRFYFVLKNSDLSVIFFYWMQVGMIIGYFIRSLKGDKDQLGLFVGTLIGVFSSLRYLFKRKNILNLLK